MKRVDESYDGREIEMIVGQTLEIHLRDNPTTGFTWKLDAKGEPACALVNDSHQSLSGKAAAGQEQRAVWQFRAEASGQGIIKLSYRRAWEPESAPAQTFTLKVRVTDSH